jgi:hypothetical protein
LRMLVQQCRSSSRNREAKTTGTSRTRLDCNVGTPNTTLTDHSLQTPLALQTVKAEEIALVQLTFCILCENKERRARKCRTCTNTGMVPAN